MSGIAEGRVSIVGELPGRLVGFRNPGNPGTPIRTRGSFKILDAMVESGGNLIRVPGTVMVDKKCPLFFTGKDLVIEKKPDFDLDEAEPIVPSILSDDRLLAFFPEADIEALRLLDKFANFIAEPNE